MKEETFRYWIYYMRSDKDIYGYTADKEVRDNFRSVRDLDNYLYEKKIDLTKADLEELTLDYQSRIIRNYELESYDWEHRKIITTTVALTEWEYTTIIGKAYSIYISDLTKYAWKPLKYFVPKVRKCLCALGYKEYHDMIHHKNNDVDSNTVVLDQLQIFLWVYQDTLKT